MSKEQQVQAQENKELQEIAVTADNSKKISEAHAVIITDFAVTASELVHNFSIASMVFIQTAKEIYKDFGVENAQSAEDAINKIINDNIPEAFALKSTISRLKMVNKTARTFFELKIVLPLDMVTFHNVETLVRMISKIQKVDGVAIDKRIKESDGTIKVTKVTKDTALKNIKNRVTRISGIAKKALKVDTLIPAEFSHQKMYNNTLSDEIEFLEFTYKPEEDEVKGYEKFLETMDKFLASGKFDVEGDLLGRLEAHKTAVNTKDEEAEAEEAEATA